MREAAVDDKRAAHTRSKSILDKSEHSSSPPLALSQISPHTSSIRYHIRTSKKNKLSTDQRRYFTVGEDLHILRHYWQNRVKIGLLHIAENLAKEIPHPEGAIRARLQRVLLRLRIIDHRLIEEEAKVWN